MEFQDWLTKIKADNPSQSDFITRLEAFFSDTGFNVVRFESRINKGLEKIEADVTKSFNKAAYAQNKEDNN